MIVIKFVKAFFVNMRINDYANVSVKALNGFQFQPALLFITDTNSTDICAGDSEGT